MRGAGNAKKRSRKDAREASLSAAGSSSIGSLKNARHAPRSTAIHTVLEWSVDDTMRNRRFQREFLKEEAGGEAESATGRSLETTDEDSRVFLQDNRGKKGDNIKKPPAAPGVAGRLD